jgi:hypothetical protein
VSSYHKNNNANIASHLCRQKEDCCIRELGTQTHHGSNNKVDSRCILSIPMCTLVLIISFSHS